MIEHARAPPIKCHPMVAHRSEPDHGTRARYQHRSLKCRCPECRAQNTRYQRTYRHETRVSNRVAWIEQTLPFNDR